MYEDDELAGKEPGGVSTLKVNCIRLIVPGRAFWEASRERSRSTARWRIRSVEALRLKSGASRDSMALNYEIRVEGRRIIGMYIPTLLFVEFIAHILRKLLKLPFGFGVVGIDH